MVDFKKMMDPAWKEEYRLKQVEEKRLAEIHEKAISDTFTLVMSRIDELHPVEKSFIRSCQSHQALYRQLSETQEKWLADIGERLSAQVMDPSKQARDADPLVDEPYAPC